jgi:ribonucleotide reductase alpha subunit
MLADENDFILDCEKSSDNDKPEDKIELLAAIQPFLTGGISAPISSVTKELCQLAWKRGLKGVSFRA